MPKDEIVKYGNDVLRQVAKPVVDFDDEIRSLIERMQKIMSDSGIGVGLAAPQVGVSKRLFVYDIGEGPHAIVNPRIEKMSGEEWGVEGCLSIPGLQGQVPRATRVVVSGLDEEGKRIKHKADGFLARVFQHEIDHLDGKLFIDRADPDTLETISEENEESDTI